MAAFSFSGTTKYAEIKKNIMNKARETYNKIMSRLKNINPARITSAIIKIKLSIPVKSLFCGNKADINKRPAKNKTSSNIAKKINNKF